MVGQFTAYNRQSRAILSTKQRAFAVPLRKIVNRPYYRGRYVGNTHTNRGGVMSEQVGALWKSDGKATATGRLNVAGIPVRIAVFPNEQKEGKQPDYRIVSFGIDQRATDQGGAQAQQAPADDGLPF